MSADNQVVVEPITKSKTLFLPPREAEKGKSIRVFQFVGCLAVVSFELA
jgi:hypothetical protein